MYKIYVTLSNSIALLIHCIYLAAKMQVFGNCTLYIDFVYLNLIGK